jgi:hypothetical protein
MLGYLLGKICSLFFCVIGGRRVTLTTRPSL